MERKVYEGYKRVSSSAKTETAKSSKTKSSSPKSTDSKQTNARLAGRSAVSKPRLAMFIDVDNVGISRENLLEILFYANGKFKIELCKLYGFSDDTLPGIRDFASEYNVTTVGKMKFKQAATNCLDSRLLIDAYECALNNKNKIDMIFIWCYPCDLESLFEKINALGINTSTIENSAFDYKNAFVSQAFKLYSPYNFSVGQSSYGQVKNEPSQINPNENLETTSTNENPIPSESVSEKNSPEEPKTESNTFMIDGVVPPVLPRRNIVERSSTKPSTNAVANTSTRGKIEEQTESKVDENEGFDTKPSSLVEEIARKLNLQVPTEEELSADLEAEEEQQRVTSEIFTDMLKRAGLTNLLDKNTLKYEDTIGDL
ncbi:MAG: NYN domain-containing protein [Clostridia bacterium]|nr:NYN domain-containing protein [Clostridia bacterium]